MHEKAQDTVYLASSNTSLLAQFTPCDECFFSRISMFDATVSVPRPENDTIPYRYEKLSAPMQFATSYILNNDPARHCFRFLDRAFLFGESEGIKSSSAKTTSLGMSVRNSDSQYRREHIITLDAHRSCG